MVGETDLNALLAAMEPVLDNRHFVFVTAKNADLASISQFDPVGTFVEREGLTAILPVTDTVAELFDVSNPFSCITLNVHSSLDAVGLTAAVATALAKEGISANVVAAYFHDHIFVNAKDGKQAQQVLMALSESYR